MRVGPGPRPSAGRTACRAFATLALSVLSLLGAGGASAVAGTGVIVTVEANGQSKQVSGSQIAAAADTGPTTYAVRSYVGGPPKAVTLHGLSIRGLITLAGLDIATVDSVTVAQFGLDTLDLTQPRFPEGPAVVAVVGARTVYLRPARAAGQKAEVVVSAPGAPLQMTVRGPTLLPLKATASRTRLKVGGSVTFHASVPAPPQGANLTYIWDFGDGTRGIGPDISHKYDTSGELQATVKVQGSGGSTDQCRTICGGFAAVDVTVIGKERAPAQQQGLPTGSGNSNNLGGTGNGGSGTGPGSGDGTGGTSRLPAAQRPPKQTRPQRATRPEPHEHFSANPKSGEGKTIIRGTLLAGAGAVIDSGLPQPKASGSPRAAKGTPGTSGSGVSIPGTMLAAMGAMWAGALRERRRVRLRLA